MRIALAGAGHWHAGMHAVAARAAHADLVGAWDADPQAAARFGAAHAVPLLPTCAALLALKPDLVVVMGRPRDAIATALACADAGLPIVLEKPAAACAADLAPLAARARGWFVAVPLPNRLGPVWGEAERLVTADRFGRLSHAGFRLINGPPDRYRVDGVPWLVDPAIAGGGALRNLGIHGVDAASQLARLAGEGLRLVSARLGHIHGEAVEDHALLTFALDGGATISVETGYTYASMAPGGDFEWRLSAANAWLVDRGDRAEAITLDDAARRDLAPAPPAERYTLFMADTLAALRAGQPPAVGLGDYETAMRFIDNAYALARREDQT